MTAKTATGIAILERNKRPDPSLFGISIDAYRMWAAPTDEDASFRRRLPRQREPIRAMVKQWLILDYQASIDEAFNNAMRDPRPDVMYVPPQIYRQLFERVPA